MSDPFANVMGLIRGSREAQLERELVELGGALKEKVEVISELLVKLSEAEDDLRATERSNADLAEMLHHVFDDDDAPPFIVPRSRAFAAGCRDVLGELNERTIVSLSTDVPRIALDHGFLLRETKDERIWTMSRRNEPYRCILRAKPIHATTRPSQYVFSLFIEVLTLTTTPGHSE